MFIGFRAIFGFGGLTGVTDPVAQNELLRKQKYFRDIFDGTGGTDTELDDELDHIVIVSVY